MQIPGLSRADVLTASLRANPVVYADAQLVPYGRYSRAKSGGPTQYDVNVSHPVDYSGKRLARTEEARATLSVQEALYRDAVRVEIGNLYTAFVDVLAARETVRYARASRVGLDRLLRINETLYQKAGLDPARRRRPRSASLSTPPAWPSWTARRRTAGPAGRWAPC